MLKIRGCGALLKVSAPAGDKKSIRCPKCEETVPLPKRGASAEESVKPEPATLRIARSDQPRRSKRNSSRSANPALSLLAGAIAFVVCGGLAYTFVSGLTRPTDPAEFAASRATSPAEPSPQASSPAQAAPAPTTITVSLDPTAAPAVSTAEDTEDAPPPGKITARSFIPAGREWLLASSMNLEMKKSALLPSQFQAAIAERESKSLVPQHNRKESFWLIDDRQMIMISVSHTPIEEEKLAKKLNGLQKEEYRGTTIYTEPLGQTPMYLVVVDRQIVVQNSDLAVLKQTIDQSLDGRFGTAGLPGKCYFALKVTDVPRLNRPFRYFYYNLLDGPDGVTNRQGQRIANPPTLGMPSWAMDLTTVSLTAVDDNGLRIVGSVDAKDQISAEAMAAYLRVNRDMLKTVVTQARKNKILEATNEQNEVIDRLLASDVTVGPKKVSLNVHIDYPSLEQLGKLFLDSVLSGKFDALMEPSKPAVASAKEPAKPPKIPPLVAVRPTFNLAGKELAAGTAFAIRWPGEKRPILLTALHLFGPSGGLGVTLKSEELPDRVTGIALCDLRTNKEIGKGGKALLLMGAYGLTEENDTSGDLAAFYLPSNTKLDARELAKDIPKVGETIWLVGQPGDQPETPQRLFAATVQESTETSLGYVFETPIELAATSGAPLVNSAGEIVGVNIGGGSYKTHCFGMGNPTPSVRKRLEAALKSK